MTIGIYAISNSVNQKVYVGKSVNIEARWHAHKYALGKVPRDKKKTNRRMWHDVQNFGIDNFSMTILESFDCVDPDTMAEREVYWMDRLQSLSAVTGYNLKRDSSSMTVVSDETRLLHKINGLGLTNPNFGKRWSPERREAMRQHKLANPQHVSAEQRKIISEKSKRCWQDKEKLRRMADKVRLSLLKYDFVQMDENFNVIRVWPDMRTLVEETGFAKQCIYSVCDGYKQRYRGFRWRKVLKDDGLLV